MDEKDSPNLGQLPNVGAKFELNGNKFRVNYIKDSKDSFRFSADLVKKHDPKE